MQSINSLLVSSVDKVSSKQGKFSIIRKKREKYNINSKGNNTQAHFIKQELA